jgi:hypothetical protein
VTGGDLRFEVADVALGDLDSQRPVESYTDARVARARLARFTEPSSAALAWGERMTGLA